MKSRPTPFFNLIRKTAFGALAAIAAAGAILAWSYSRYAADNREQVENIRKEQIAKRRLFSLIEELAEIHQAKSSFIHLREQGVLGDLNKTRLLDQVETALIPFGDAVLNYKLDGHKEFSRPALSQLARHRFGLHRLQLNFRPLDEVEFVKVWRALASSSSGVTPVESCELTRKDSGSDGAPLAESVTAGTPKNANESAPRLARLDARCVLTNYSIRFEAGVNPASSITAAAATIASTATAPVTSTARGSR